MNELDELQALGDAIADTSAVADATIRLRDELVALGAHIEVDPMHWHAAMRAQREVEAVYFEIHNAVMAQAAEGLR